MKFAWLRDAAIAILACASIAWPSTGWAQNQNPATVPGGEPYKKVFDGYTKVVSTTDGAAPLIEIWIDKKNHRMLGKLPKDYARKRFFIALTVSSGEKFAGLQADDMYVYWKKVGDRIALIEPNVEVRSTGDTESKRSVKRLFTDRVIIDMPILATSPRNEPVISLDELLVRNAPKFFGSAVSGANPTQMYRLREIVKAKAFPQNAEIAFRVPVRGGRLKTLHYSISVIPDNTGYKPRKADDRVGYFTTAFDDLGKYKEGTTRTRYINRWHLEKADPKLKLSPPKKPIIFYIEHTTPIRYRRFVRQGVLYWNKAFEKVGLVNAIEVYFQDAATGAHMEKDPEDVRYNFIRWLNNDVATAIGPSRVHPLTGQILDADIILTDGWIRVFEKQFSELLPKLAMEGFSPETLAWLERHPRWDPRYLLLPPSERNLFLARLAQRGFQRAGGHPLANVRSRAMGDDEYDGLVGRVSQVNGMCMAAWGKAVDLTLLRMTLATLDEEGEQTKDDNLDGIPARFIGPLLADLVAHEVGHTLGLRHNFKASAAYSFQDINSPKFKGKKPFTASVMDYNPININMKMGKLQGDYAMIDIGPYDMWAIEYGYTFDEDNLDKILARCTERELQYATDQDTVGPDPFARRYDFSANPLDYAKNQMRLADYHRKRLIDKFVKKGESWAKARRGYILTLALQTKALSMMANWIGGAYVRRDHKGDKGDRDPIAPVPAKVQREALQWVLAHAFRDEAFGLSPKLLRRLRTDSLKADESFSGLKDATFPVHDRIMGIQASVLTMLLKPTTLRRVYDNELMLENDQDALTLPELIETIEQEVWRELNAKPDGKFSNRKPAISSLRRNLQREYIERLIDLIEPDSSNTAASRPISTIALAQLRDLNKRIEAFLKATAGRLDRYSEAHLRDAQTRITKALESQYVRPVGAAANTGGIHIILGQTGAMRCTVPGCRCAVNGPQPAAGEWRDER